MAESPIIEAVMRQRARLEANDTASMRRLIEAYSRMQRRLQGQIDALVMQIAEEGLSKGRVTRLTRYRDLLAQVEEESRALAGLLRAEVDAVAEFGISFGENGARQLINVSLAEAGVQVQLNRLPTETIETLLGFLAPDSPLYARIQALAPVQAQRIADAILDGVGLGYNSRKIAAAIEQKLGMGLTDALRMVRTVQNWSYREASRATYVANSDILDGWVWHANLNDSRTCMSCIAQHGKEFPLDQPLNDHHNGRCAAIPKVKGFPNPVTETGEDWFRSLSAEKQREFMGPGLYEAWQAGKFDIADISTENTDDVYGRMRVQAPLKALVDE